VHVIDPPDHLPAHLASMPRCKS